MAFTGNIALRDSSNPLRTDVEHQLYTHKGKFIFQGILFILAGILAAAFPAATAHNVEMLVGLILFVLAVC